MSRIVLYTVQGCGYCRVAKQMLTAAGVAFEELDITFTPNVREELAEKSGGEWSVPQIYIDGKYFGQDDEIRILIDSGRLDELLK